ncbi:unnamed protein product [Calypogeia fissa]
MNNFSHFHAWQQQRHQSELVQQNFVGDSQPAFMNQVLEASLAAENSQPNNFLSNEEFDRLMNQPAPGHVFLQPPSQAMQQQAQLFSGPPSMIQDRDIGEAQAQGRKTSICTEAEQTKTPEETTGKKRGAKKTIAKKGKKPKKVVEISDGEDGDDRIVLVRWTDPEVIQLISFRHEMDTEFKNNAKKQGLILPV